MIDDALRTGAISYSKVRAMTRVATSANESMLLEDARHATGQQLELICRKYATVVRAAKEVDEDYDRQRRTVTRRDLEDGMVRIEATLHPDEAAVVWAALDRIATERCKDRSVDHAPADRAPADHAPADHAPADHAPADHAPADHAPADRAPADRAPADRASSGAVEASHAFVAVSSPELPFAVTAQDSTVDSEVALPASSPRRFSRADALIDMAQGVVRGDSPRRSPIELVVTIAADVLHGRAGERQASTAVAIGACASAETSHALSGAVDACVSAETRDAPDDVCGAAVDSSAGSLQSGLQGPAPLAVFADGTCVSAETARRLACDCGIVHVTEDEHGNPLTVGRKTRSIPSAIARALLKRDACCRFPGCGNRVYVEGHHIEHWASGGETSLRNLVSVCGFHHRFVHEYGYSVVLDEAQCPHFYDPRGHEMFDVPDRPRPAALGWPAVIDLNAPLAIEANTNECLWDGDQPSYVDIIDALVRVDGVQ